MKTTTPIIALAALTLLLAVACGEKDDLTTPQPNTSSTSTFVPLDQWLKGGTWVVQPRLVVGIPLNRGGMNAVDSVAAQTMRADPSWNEYHANGWPRWSPSFRIMYNEEMVAAVFDGEAAHYSTPDESSCTYTIRADSVVTVCSPYGDGECRLYQIGRDSMLMLTPTRLRLLVRNGFRPALSDDTITVWPSGALEGRWDNYCYNSLTLELDESMTVCDTLLTVYSNKAGLQLSLPDIFSIVDTIDLSTVIDQGFGGPHSYDGSGHDFISPYYYRGGCVEVSFSCSRAEAVARLKRCENVCAIEPVRIKRTQDGAILFKNMGRHLWVTIGEAQEDEDRLLEIADSLHLRYDGIAGEGMLFTSINDFEMAYGVSHIFHTDHSLVNAFTAINIMLESGIPSLVKRSTQCGVVP